jgi:L-lactate utilization protein LutB
MSLEEQVLIFQSANVMHALLVQNHLVSEGIEVINPDRMDGQVWIKRQHAANAVQVLKEYIKWINANSDEATVRADESVEVTCEDCGRIMVFAGTLLGSVQECNHCFTYLDVGGDDETFGDEWKSVEE